MDSTTGAMIIAKIALPSPEIMAKSMHQSVSVNALATGADATTISLMPITAITPDAPTTTPALMM